jgi:hypothetical protein
VRVINGDQLDANTPQTGVFRQAAINHARVGVQKIWAGTVSIAPDACAKAVGRATPKAIRRRPAAVGKKVTARNVAMMTMSDRAVQAGETTNIEAVRGMMRIVVMKAGTVPMMTTTVARLRAMSCPQGAFQACEQEEINYPTKWRPRQRARRVQPGRARLQFAPRAQHPRRRGHDGRGSRLRQGYAALSARTGVLGALGRVRRPMRPKRSDSLTPRSSRCFTPNSGSFRTVCLICAHAHLVIPRDSMPIRPLRHTSCGSQDSGRHRGSSPIRRKNPLTANPEPTANAMAVTKRTDQAAFSRRCAPLASVPS